MNINSPLNLKTQQPLLPRVHIGPFNSKKIRSNVLQHTKRMEASKINSFEIDIFQIDK